MVRRRHGTMLDLPLIIVSVLVVGIGVITATLILDEVIKNTTDDQIDQDVLNKADTALHVYDTGILIVAGGMLLSALILAYRIPTSPVFFVPSLIFGTVSIYLAAEATNIFDKIARTDAFNSTVNSFPAMVTFFDRFPYIIGGSVVVMLVALYARRTADRGRI